MVFQDDEDTTVAKKRKLPIPPTSSSHDKKSGGKDRDRESSDDKRRHIKSLIDKIPTAKNALFEYKVEWDLVSFIIIQYIVITKEKYVEKITL